MKTEGAESAESAADKIYKMNFQLKPYQGIKSRNDCPNPNCNGKKTFVRYIDSETGEEVSPIVGRCNREVKCGYHYSPKQYFQDNPIYQTTKATINRVSKPETTITKSKPISFIHFNYFKNSLSLYAHNNFTVFLYSILGRSVRGRELIKTCIEKYYLATSKFWLGANVFWQIDILGRIRTGKIMLYDIDSGRRVKQKINWVHSVLKMPKYVLCQCFFGEHLLKEKYKPVAIVESEKTAIIASLYLPQYTWLAAGSLSNLSTEKFKVLIGRKVTFFPDLNGYEKWEHKLKELAIYFKNIEFRISDLLEKKATQIEKINGLDLADYLIQLDIDDFYSEAINETQIFIQDTKLIECKDYIAYIDEKGQLYIPTPLSTVGSFTVHDSIDSYNNRNGFPRIMNLNQNFIQKMKTVKINHKTLTINT